MSAISAILRADGGAAKADAARMIDAMASRAPDGIRVWSAGPVGLGHGALHTTREAAAEQLPKSCRGEAVAITADARLDNRAELLAEVRADASDGDGEVIMAAYNRWGEGCLERLLGDFAFAIWDARKQALFCACDRFAVKPLYWHRSSKLFAVGTEIKALLALEELPRRLNEPRFADFLTIHVVDPTSTIFRDVCRLPAAHALTVDRQGARLRPYWSAEASGSADFSSDADYEEAFRSAFMQAVTNRLRSHRPMAAALSGGMDSSSIVVVAREILRTRAADRLPLKTISASFSAVPGTDEREYIDAVLELDGLRPHFVFPQRLDPLEDWEGAAWRGAEPELAPQRTLAHAIYAAAAELGTNCVLEGEGGDEVVSHGTRRLTELAKTRRWITLMREARALGRRAELGTVALLRAFAISPFLPNRAWTFRQRLREHGAGMPYWYRGVPLDPEFVRRASLLERYEGEYQALERQPRDPRRAHRDVLTSPRIPLGLSIADRLAALHGVEPRYPFLDSRFAELCLAVPAEQKLRGGYNRDLMRRALDDLLPAKVRYRGSKARPGAHIAHTLPTKGRKLMDDVILRNPDPIADYVKIDRVREQYSRCLAGANSNEWFPVWRVVVGSLWLANARARYRLES